jgi:hypothetical protein
MSPSYELCETQWQDTQSWQNNFFKCQLEDTTFDQQDHKENVKKNGDFQKFWSNLRKNGNEVWEACKS